MSTQAPRGRRVAQKNNTNLRNFYLGIGAVVLVGLGILIAVVLRPHQRQLTRRWVSPRTVTTIKAIRMRQ